MDGIPGLDPYCKQCPWVINLEPGTLNLEPFSSGLAYFEHPSGALKGFFCEPASNLFYQIVIGRLFCLFINTIFLSQGESAACDRTCRYHGWPGIFFRIFAQSKAAEKQRYTGMIGSPQTG